MSFSEFGLSPEILDGIRDMGYSKPTPIQQQAIPLVLEGRDIVASAQTGTGKTAAFVVPILEKLLRSPNKGLQCLILSPTRELAQQIDEQIFAIGYYADIPSVTIYGGGDWGEQQRALERGVRIIVATPGRLLDLIKVRNIDFSNIDILVLDEADRMLDMGFIPDVRTIINRVPKQRQTLFFSATIHDKLAPLLEEFLVDPVRVSIAPNKAAKGVNQWMYFVEHDLKADLVRFLMQDDRFPSAIVFASTKRGADELARELRRRKLTVASIHGDRTQQEREDALEAFKSGNIRVLVATDVLARGIDIEEVSLVINYDVPREVEDYIHRIGRTARADAKGDAITFVAPQDRRYLEPIRKSMGDKLVILDVPAEILGTRAPVSDRDYERNRGDRRQDGDRRHEGDRRQDGDRGGRRRQNDGPRPERHQPAPEPQAPIVDESQPVAEMADMSVMEAPSNRRRSNRRGPRRQDTEPRDEQQAPAVDERQPIATPSISAPNTEDAFEDSPEQAERRRRRSRGGRNRRRRRPQDGESTSSEAPKVEAHKQEPKPQQPQARRPDSNRPPQQGNREGNRDQRPARNTDKTQAGPESNTRRQFDRNNGPRNENPRNNGGNRGQERGNRPNQNQGRGNRRDRSPNYGVSHKLPVTNDLSSMSTSIKGSHSHHKKEAEPKKGMFGFIKKLFGKDE